MLRSLGKLPLSVAVRHEARAKAKIGPINGHLSNDQHNILKRQQKKVERDIKLEKTKHVARIAEPGREKTRRMLGRIIHNNSVLQGFRGQAVEYE